MIIDLETELRSALKSGTDLVHADADRLLRRLAAPRRPRRGRVATAVAASVLLVAAVAVADATVARGRNTRDSLGSSTGVDRVPGPFPAWGPTRGQLRGDDAFLASVRAESVRPTSEAGPSSIFAPQREAGPLQILWAGNTPVGPAAVTAQAVLDFTTDGDALYVSVGMLASDSGGRLRLVHRNVAQAGSAQELLNNIGFLPSPAGRYVVVVPADPSTRVQVTPHGAGLGHEAERRWQDALVVDGAAVADIGAGNLGRDALFGFGDDPDRTGDFDIPSPSPPETSGRPSPGTSRTASTSPGG
ncbi:MAG: hypothetical protein QOE84_2641 [Actinomycetota bacterium]|nr:hypothetical protein [Actinomycetota bacterium]